MEQVIVKTLFSLAAGFMLSFSGAMFWDYYKNRRTDKRFAVIVLTSCVIVLVTNQLF